LENVLSTCLELDPESRWQSARELKHVLVWAVRQQPSSSQNRTFRLGWMVAAATLALGAGLMIGAWKLQVRQPAAENPYHLYLGAPEEGRFSFRTALDVIAVSPDGATVAFVATVDRKDALWLRPLNSPTARQLPGTDGAHYPFWSPDNKSIGYFAEGKLNRIEVAGGRPTTICEILQPRGGAWSKMGRSSVVLGPDCSRSRLPAEHPRA
jgi:eukaryotic-like serine/threonine-protein kinase